MKWRKRLLVIFTLHLLTGLLLDSALRVQEQAGKADKSYSVEVWRPSAAQLVTIQIAAPPSLPSLF
jgi:hypothetical protein